MVLWDIVQLVCIAGYCPHFSFKIYKKCEIKKEQKTLLDIRRDVFVNTLGAIQVLRNAMGWGGGGCQLSQKSVTKEYGSQFTRGWVGVKLPEKNYYVTR